MPKSQQESYFLAAFLALHSTPSYLVEYKAIGNKNFLQNHELLNALLLLYPCKRFLLFVFTYGFFNGMRLVEFYILLS